MVGNILASFELSTIHLCMISSLLGAGVSFGSQFGNKYFGVGKSLIFLSRSRTIEYGGIFAPKAVVITLCKSFEYCQVHEWTG